MAYRPDSALKREYKVTKEFWKMKEAEGQLKPGEPNHDCYDGSDFEEQSARLEILPSDSVLLEKTAKNRKTTVTLLGTGSFATVYAGKYSQSSTKSWKECAVKVFNEDVKPENVQKECEIMNACMHPNVVSAFGMVVDLPCKGRQALALVMELCDHSLHKYIGQHHKKGAPREMTLQILLGITKAMVFLHSRNIIHGDLNSENVLVNEKDDVIIAKVADFGRAQRVDETYGEHITSNINNADYLPPEVFMKKADNPKERVRITRKVDVFCFGPIVIELGCGEFPDPNAKTFAKKGKQIMRNEIQRREKSLKKVKRSEREFVELIVQQCMADKPEERVSFSDLHLSIERNQKSCKDPALKEILDEKMHEIEDMSVEYEKAKVLLRERKLRIQFLEKKNTDIEQIISSKDEKATNLSKKLEEMETQQKHLEKELRCAKERLEDNYRKQMDLNEKCLEEQREKMKCSEESARLEKAKKDLQDQVAKLEEINAVANNQAMRAAKEKKALEATIAKLEAEVKEISLQRDRFRESCQIAVSDVTKLQNKLKANNEELKKSSNYNSDKLLELETAHQDEKSHWESERKSLEKCLKDKISQLEMGEKTLKALKEQSRQDITDVVQERNALEQKLNDKTELSSANEKLKEEMTKMKESFKCKEKAFQNQFDKEQQRLEKEVQGLKKDREDLRNKHDSLLDEIKCLMIASDNCMNKRDDLCMERDDLKRQLEISKRESKQYKTERDDVQSDKERLENDVARLSHDHREAKQEAKNVLDKLSEELQSSKQEMQKAQEFVGTCLKECDKDVKAELSLQALLEALNEAHINAVLKLQRSAESSLKSVESLHERKMNEASKKQKDMVNELNQQLSVKDKEMEKLSLEKLSLEQKIMEMEAADRDMNKTVQIFSRKNTSLMGEVKNLKERLSVKKGEDTEQEQERLTRLHEQLQNAQQEKEEMINKLSNERNSSANQQKEITCLQEANKALKQKLIEEKEVFYKMRDALREHISITERELLQLKEEKKSLHEYVVCCIEQTKVNLLNTLREQSARAHEKLIAGQALMAKNKELVATCQGYEKQLAVLRRKWMTTRSHMDKMKEICQGFHNNFDAIKVKLDCCEKRLNETKICLQAKDERINELQEKLQQCSEMELQLTDVAANADTLRLDNQRLLGVEEANRKTILDLVNDQKQQANQIFILEEKQSKLCENLSKVTSDLHCYQRQLVEKTEECIARQKVEEDLNNKIAGHVHCSEQLAERNEEIEGLLLKVESGKVVHEVIATCLVRECKVDIKRLESQLSVYKSECHRVTKSLTKMEAELRETHSELVQTKRKYKVRKQDYYDSEDTQMNLLTKVADLEAHNQSLKERKCNDDSHAFLEAENEDIKKEIAELESRFEMVSSEKDSLQSGHDYLAETLKDKNMVCQSLEEENEKLRIHGKKQEKRLKARHKLLESGEADLRRAIQEVEIKQSKLQALNENLQKQEDILQTLTKLIEESKKEWREMQRVQKQAMDSDRQQMLLQQQSAFVQHMNAMVDQYDRQIKLVKAQSEDVPKFVNFSLQTMRDFMIPYLLYLQLPTWLTDDSNQGPVVPGGELSQLCEIESSRIAPIQPDSLFPTGSSKCYSRIHSECPKTVNDIVKIIRENYEREFYRVYSITFLKSTDKVYLCHLLIGIVPKMIAPHSMKLEPDILYSLVQVALIDKFGIEMQKAATVDSLSRGVVYNPEWYGRKAPQWSHDMVYEELPFKAVPVFKHLQQEAAHGLKKEIVSLMTRIPC